MHLVYLCIPQCNATLVISSNKSTLLSVLQNTGRAAIPMLLLVVLSMIG